MSKKLPTDVPETAGDTVNETVERMKCGDHDSFLIVCIDEDHTMFSAHLTHKESYLVLRSILDSFPPEIVRMAILHKAREEVKDALLGDFKLEEDNDSDDLAESEVNKKLREEIEALIAKEEGKTTH